MNYSGHYRSKYLYLDYLYLLYSFYKEHTP